MKKFALIVAGGTGSRMKTALPKQFIELAGKPVLMRTIEAFSNHDSEIEIILVLPQNQVKMWKSLCSEHHFDIPCKIAFGGDNRFQSVRNGLELIASDGVVFIHDGVRPLVSPQTLMNCYETASVRGNALPVVPVTESIRYTDEMLTQAVDRTKFVIVQTPQTFKTGLIQRAYQQAVSQSFTDDAAVLEDMGESIQLVEGNRENIKITFPEDLIFADALLKNKNLH